MRRSAAWVLLGISLSGASRPWRRSGRDTSGCQSGDRFSLPSDDPARGDMGIRRRSGQGRRRAEVVPSRRAVARPGDDRGARLLGMQGIGGPGKSRPVTPERSIRSLRGSYVGTAWYRRTVAVPADWFGKQVWLKIGGVHAQGWFWVNGSYLGHEELRRAGLTWEWGMACHDAGNRLQSVYQKRGLESARLDPNCGGYIYWTVVDVGSPAAQGLLNQFWEPKASTAAFFRQFPLKQAIDLAPLKAGWQRQAAVPRD